MSSEAPSSAHNPTAEEGAPTLLFFPLAALAISGFFGIAFSPYLAVKAPLALIALSPLIRHLVVVAPTTDPVLFSLVAVLRLFAADPFLFVIGRRYGPRSLVWIEARSVAVGRAVRIFERIFQRAGLLLVFITPGVAVCTLAGVVGMPARRFVAANLLGTVSLVVLVRLVGESFSEPIKLLIEFFELHLRTLTAGSVALTVAGWLVWRHRTRARLRELERRS